MKPAWGEGDFSSVIVPVAEAERAVARWRAEHDWSARFGVPAHVTIQGPFLPPDRLECADLAALGRLFGRFAPFSFSLLRVERVPGSIYLAPAPVEPFAALSHELALAWPEASPYEHTFGGAGFHLTVAREEGSRDLLDAIGRELTPLLPIRCQAREAWLVEKRADVVRQLDRFPLGV